MTVTTYNPPSANGFCLRYTNETATWYLTAAWPAPYFLLIEDDTERPLFVHCESLEHAASYRYGNGEPMGKIFDATFQPVARTA